MRPSPVSFPSYIASHTQALPAESGYESTCYTRFDKCRCMHRHVQQQVVYRGNTTIDFGNTTINFGNTKIDFLNSLVDFLILSHSAFQSILQTQQIDFANTIIEFGNRFCKHDNPFCKHDNRFSEFANRFCKHDNRFSEFASRFSDFCRIWRSIDNGTLHVLVACIYIDAFTIEV